MKILVLADVESKYLWDYFEKEKLEGIDLILSAGDLKPQYLSFLASFSKVPVLYVHGNHEGKKFDLIKANPHVFIEIDGSDEALVSGGDIPCKYSSVYSSVMGRGEAALLKTTDEKSHGLQVLMKHQIRL